MNAINKIQSAQNLEELLEIINDLRDAGVDLENGELTDLPTFGGDEPKDTTSIWSWDEGNLLVGEGDWEIVSRKEWCEQ